MSEHNNNDNFKTVASFTVKLRSNGSINIEGPLHDKILCYGLLHMAMEILSVQKAQEQNKIIKPMLIPPADILKG